MSSLLSKAIRKIEALPKELQNEIAAQLLEDVEGELKWQKTLAKPQSKLGGIADQALQQSEAGKTRKAGFDEL
jgi:hypothetical protein